MACHIELVDFHDVSNSAQSANTTLLYSERQWVPWYWWVIAVAFVSLLSVNLSLNRSWVYFAIGFVLFGALIAWLLIYWSRTTIRVEQDADGSRWLIVGRASLPAEIVTRSLAVPPSAKRNAMGRQLDPAAFVVSHTWIKSMVMLVLDDPEDPTPYWLIGTKNPEKLLRAFLPEQADTALAHFK